MKKTLLKWFFKGFFKTVRYDGFSTVLWRALKLCLLPFGTIGMVELCRKDLTKPLDEKHAAVPVDIDQAYASDVDELVALVEKRYGPVKNIEWYSRLGIRGTILDRFQHGAKCFVARIDGKSVHYNWIFFHHQEWVPGTKRYINLKDGEAFCDDGFTLEPWRGKSIHMAVNFRMLLFLKQAKYLHAYTVVSSYNKSSQKALSRINWEFFCTMLFFTPRWAKRTWVWQFKGEIAPLIERETKELPAKVL